MSLKGSITISLGGDDAAAPARREKAAPGAAVPRLAPPPAVPAPDEGWADFQSSAIAGADSQSSAAAGTGADDGSAAAPAPDEALEDWADFSSNVPGA